MRISAADGGSPIEWRDVLARPGQLTFATRRLWEKPGDSALAIARLDIGDVEAIGFKVESGIGARRQQTDGADAGIPRIADQSRKGR